MREHRVHAGDGERAREIDRAHARVRVRAAERVTPEHPGRLQVARVLERPGRLRSAVDAADALADPPELGRRVRGMTLLMRAPRRADGVEDLCVARAAAEVAGERLADLVVVGSGV